MNQPIELRSMQALLPRRWLAALWLFVLAGFGAAGAPSDSASTISPSAASNATEKSPWQRVMMLGASATAGFNVAEPLGVSKTPLYDLSRYVDAALKVPHEPVQNFGNTFFFLQPQLFARQQLTQALTNKPTLIIGVDFLFWFCYGEGRTDENRLQRFDQGLKLLEKVDCPLVVGDIPDASAAVNGMLRPDQIPSFRSISAANLRLKEWAAGRRQVAIVKLSDFMRNALANRAITIHSYVLPAGQTRVLLQDDKLHSSPSGCAVLALAVLDAFQSTRKGIRAEEFQRDPKEIFRRVSNTEWPPSSMHQKQMRHRTNEAGFFMR